MEGCEYGDREMGCEVRPALDCYYPDLAAACCLTCSGLLMQNATPGMRGTHAAASRPFVHVYPGEPVPER